MSSAICIDRKIERKLISSAYLCAANYDDESEQTSSELSVEGSAESMLIVERGLRELAALKVLCNLCYAMSTSLRLMLVINRILLLF